MACHIYTARVCSRVNLCGRRRVGEGRFPWFAARVWARTVSAGSIKMPDTLFHTDVDDDKLTDYRMPARCAGLPSYSMGLPEAVVGIIGVRF